jgi:hypothetical protein
MKKTVTLFLMLASFIGMGQAIKFGALGGGFSLGGGVRGMFYDTIDKKLYVSGQFQKADNNYVWGVAVWDGIKWDSLQGGFTQYPHQPSNPNDPSDFAFRIVRFQNRIYFAGGIYWVNGKNQYNMAVWDLNTSSWVYPIAQPPNNVINDLKVYNNTLYACGLFTKFGNTTCKYVAKFDGVNWQPVGDFTQFDNNSQGPAQMNCIEFYKNEIYVGGAFDDMSDMPKNLAKYDGSNWVNVSIGIQQGGLTWVECMEVFNNKLYIGGYFVGTSEIPGNGFITWDGVSFGLAGSYLLNGSGYVKLLKSHKNKLFVMGSFLSYGPYPAYNMFYIDTLKQCSINGLESTFTHSATSGFNCCELINDSLIVGGGFQYLDTIVANSIGVITNFENNSSCLITGLNESFFEHTRVKIFPNPVKDKLVVEFQSTNSEKINLSIFNSLSQMVYSIDRMSQKQEIDLTFLPNGIYFLKLQNNSEQKVLKIIKN